MIREDILTYLKKYYPINYYGSIGTRRFDDIAHTNKTWKDGVAVYKYFDRDPKCPFVSLESDKVFIGLSKNGIYDNLYFCYRENDWYFVNQFRNPEIYEILKSYIIL